MAIETHEVHSAALLAHAPLMLEEGERLQASEKIWGAVSHAVSNIAAKRGWPNRDYADKEDIVRYLSVEANQPDFVSLYAAARGFHANSHEDTKDESAIWDGIESAKEMVRLLQEADASLPGGLSHPRGERFRRYERRHGIEPDPPYSLRELERFAAETRRRSEFARREADAAKAKSV